MPNVVMVVLIGMIPLACGRRSEPATVPTDAVGSSFWAGLEPGEFAVGYRSADAHGNREASTILDASGLLLFVWYPAIAGSGAQMRFADYFHQTLSVTANPTSMGRELARRVTPDSSAWQGAVWERILGQPVAARVNAEKTSGSFPVLLWSTRHETLAAQFVLSEYLASHGYVVVAARPVTGEPPAPYTLSNRAERPEILSSILADLDTALSASLRLPESDSTNVGMLSWSYGGEAASMLQRRRSEVDIVVSLSSNVLDGWAYQTADTLPGADADRLTARYVLLTETVMPNETSREDPTVLDYMAGSSVVISFPELRHGNFNVFEGLLPGLMDESVSVQPWSRGGAVARLGYRAIVEHVHRQLESLFRPKAPAKSIDRWEGFAEVRSRPGRLRRSTEELN